MTTKVTTLAAGLLAGKLAAEQVPDYSNMTAALGQDFDPENSGGRFNRRLALAIVIPEPDWVPYGSAEQAVVRQAGEWLLETDAALGKPQAGDGSVGRGAEGWIPVVEWARDAIGGGVVDLIVAAAAAKILTKLRQNRREKEEKDATPFYISRGMAAAVAADEVASALGDRGPLEVEAVEEPSSIAGVLASETSYVGIEPWVVLLRNVEGGRRYFVVVAPDGEIMGRIETALLEWETMFLQPPEQPRRRLPGWLRRPGR